MFRHLLKPSSNQIGSNMLNLQEYIDTVIFTSLWYYIHELHRRSLVQAYFDTKMLSLQEYIDIVIFTLFDNIFILYMRPVQSYFGVKMLSLQEYIDTVKFTASTRALLLSHKNNSAAWEILENIRPMGNALNVWPIMSE